MKGLELSELFWENIARPRLERAMPQILDVATVGLVGEGSECWGFDDSVSRDHDWGPGFCLWLNDDDMALYGDALREYYEGLPQEYMGARRLHVLPQTEHRVGPCATGDFYSRYLGISGAPNSIDEWRHIPEFGLSAATNGKVFQDPAGRFTAIREALLAYYPESLRMKKLAMNCALAGQSGQYNYRRCLAHGEPVAAMAAMTEFIRHIQAVVFLLNRRYRPYYKWTDRAMRSLPLLGAKLSPLMRRLIEEPDSRTEFIEEISALVISELRAEGLSCTRSDFLLDHGEEIQSGIKDEFLQSLPLMAE